MWLNGVEQLSGDGALRWCLRKFRWRNLPALPSGGTDHYGFVMACC